MAIGSMRGAAARVGSNSIVHSGSMFGVWQCVNDDCRTITAPAAADLFGPSTIVSSLVHWVSVPTSANRVFVQARAPKGATGFSAATTRVCILGAYRNDSIVTVAETATPESTASASGNAAEFRFARIDEPGYADLSAVDLAFDATPATSDTAYDSLWWYSAIYPATNDVVGPTAIQLRGAHYITGVVTVALAISAGTDSACPIDVLFVS